MLKKAVIEEVVAGNDDKLIWCATTIGHDCSNEKLHEKANVCVQSNDFVNLENFFAKGLNRCKVNLSDLTKVWKLFLLLLLHSKRKVNPWTLWWSILNIWNCLNLRENDRCRLRYRDCRKESGIGISICYIEELINAKKRILWEMVVDK